MPNEAKLLAERLASFTPFIDEDSEVRQAAALLLKLDKQNRQYEKSLKGIVKSIEAFLALLDRTLTHPANELRGKEIARLCNALDMAKDRVRFGVLNIDFRTGKKRTAVKPTAGKKRRAV